MCSWHAEGGLEGAEIEAAAEPATAGGGLEVDSDAEAEGAGSALALGTGEVLGAALVTAQNNAVEQTAQAMLRALDIGFIGAPALLDAQTVHAAG